MTTVLFWDIDGTLLTTARAGIFALEAATKEVVGHNLDLNQLNTAGLTDRRIAINVLELAGIESTPERVDQLLSLYGTYLPEYLPYRQGTVLPGVKEILDQIQNRSDVLSLLLTGNIAAGAKAKLTYYGLDGYFKGGAFADQYSNRHHIAEAALNLAQAMLGSLDQDKIYVIGDTPHDIDCSRAIGAKAIAVASGSYSLESLEQHNPWWLLPSLPPTPVFLTQLGLNHD